MPKRSICFAVLMLAGTAAGAGTILETVNRELAAGAQGASGNTTITTYVQGGRMRVETKPGDTLMIFKDDAIYSINARDKSYFVLDRAAAKRLADQINPALKQMQEQLAKMPPEQRAQLEKMMGPQMAGMGKQTTQSVRKTGRSDKIGGHACSYIELLEDGTLSEEMCVAAPGTLKGSQELLDAAAKISALLQEMFSALDTPWLKDSISREVANYEKIGGVPLLSRHFSDGKPVSETTLQSIRSETVGAALFDVPAGYTKKDMLAQR